MMISILPVKYLHYLYFWSRKLPHHFQTNISQYLKRWSTPVKAEVKVPYVAYSLSKKHITRRVVWCIRHPVSNTLTTHFWPTGYYLSSRPELIGVARVKPINLRFEVSQRAT